MDTTAYFSLVNHAHSATTPEELAAVRLNVLRFYRRDDAGVSGVLEACDRREREFQERRP